MTSAQQPDGPTLLLKNQTSSILDDHPYGWQVESGQAQVYRLEVRAGEGEGLRQHLFIARAGDILFGAVDFSEDGGDWHFLVQAEGKCQLRKLSVETRWSDGIAGWVSKLAENILEDRSSPLAPLAQAASSHLIQLAEGQMIRFSDERIRWIRVDEGRASFLGVASLACPSDPGLLPLHPGTWIRAETPLQLSVLDPAAIEPTQLAQGIAQWNGLILAYLAWRDQRQATRESQRLQERQHRESTDTRQALAQFGSLLGQPIETVPARTELLTALQAVGQRLGITFRESADSSTVKESSRTEADPVEAIARASRARFRRLRLPPYWWRRDCGPLLGSLCEGKQERPVALLRNFAGTYEMLDPRRKERRPLPPTAGQAPENPPHTEVLSPDAVMFYRPLPDRPLTLLDLPFFALRHHRQEMLLVLGLVVLVTILGMAIPMVTRWLIDLAIPEADQRFLVELGLVLLAVTFGQAVFLASQGLITQRAQTGGTVSLQSAFVDRLLRLPIVFFHRFTSADLLNRVMLVTQVSQSLNGTLLRSFFTGGVSVIYLGLLFYYGKSLAVLGLLIGLLSVAVTAALALGIRRQALALMQVEGPLLGFVVQIINGIAKLRVAGAEQRAYNHWAPRHAQLLRKIQTIKLLEDCNTLFTLVIPVVGSMVLFALSVRVLDATPSTKQVSLSLGQFVAFLMAYGLFMSGLTGMSQALIEVTDTLAKQRLMRPLLESEQEFSPSSADPGNLRGEVALEDVSFSYHRGADHEGPLVLDGVNLVAHPGECIAVVGPSGSGKSTLVRLLLGFARPDSGRVVYDGQNLDGLNLTAVRRQLGIVLQSTYILGGTLFDNITAGHLASLEEAWQAAEDADLAEDIRQMPMQMQTTVAEMGSNLSGGQRQRLLIARALVTHPKILIFDEATSALDSVTQARITANLERRKVTRILVAHRLSTIEHADRIYVLQKGKIVQSGTFEELLAQEGIFQRLMARQEVGTPASSTR